MACPNLNQTCIQACIQAGNPASQQVFMALGQCAIQVCGFPLDMNCFQKAAAGPCSNEYAACKMDFGP